MALIPKLTLYISKNPAVRNNFKLKNNTPVFKLDRDVVVFSNKIDITHVLPRNIARTSGKTEQVTATLLPKTAFLNKKITIQDTGQVMKVPYEVNIARHDDSYMTTFHFLDKNTKQEIGYVSIIDWRKAPDIVRNYNVNISRLQDDFPELGITGDRISIDFLQNNFEDTFSGVGKLADRLAIEYCLKNGLKPNITSVAEYNSHAAHYLRGRRFLEVSKYDPDIDAYEFKKEYGTLDPNKIIEERIKNTPKGQRVDTSDLGGLYMYMPQNVINKYLAEIKANPLLS